MLSKELSQLDTADEKLEKMLEGGIDTDSSSFTGDGGGQQMMGAQGVGGGMMDPTTGGGQWNPSASVTGGGGDAFEMQVCLKAEDLFNYFTFDL